jgi:3-hydroxy-9,10-secoandrosta-1,3,5(10)-triene-9,17-dione monooxygenase
VEAYRDYTLQRVRVAYGDKAAADPFSQVRLAEAAGELDDARTQLRRNMDELMELAEAGERIPDELRIRIRRDQVRGSRAAVQATDRVFESAGGKALFLDKPIQRAWRDVHAARVHAVNDTERGLLIYGAHALGGEIPPGSLI